MSTTTATPGHPVNNTKITSGNTLEVKSGGTASYDVLLNGATEIVDGGGLTYGTQVDTGATLYDNGVAIDTQLYGTEIVGGGAADLGTTVFNGGDIEVTSGGIADFTVVENGGNLIADTGATIADLHLQAGGRAFLDSGSVLGGFNVVAGGTIFGTSVVTSNGELTVDGGSVGNVVLQGATLDLADGPTGTAPHVGTVDLAGTGNLLEIDAANIHPGEVMEFGAGDTLDLTFLKFDGSDSYTVSGNTVTFTDGSESYSIVIDGASGDKFQFSDDGNGNLDVTVCYYPGTAIRTPRGDVAVETLKIGDEVITADGAVQAIRWMGRNTVSTRFADPQRALPIRIRAGALDGTLPLRDLLVSPQHAMLVDGVLIQAAALVNGTSIVRETDVPEVFVYHHVELADHALILAEGAASETFVDNIDRMAFDNWAEHEALYGDAPVAELALPRAKSARQVPAATQQRLVQLAEQLGHAVRVAA